MLATAGGAFVKVGQLLATRRDLFDSEFARQLERLHEQASRADFNACIRDLPQPVSARLVGEYRVDNARPLGSGAVAQVFAAVRHADGAPVAIKVIRKRSRGLVLRDAAAMRSLARRMSQLRVVSSVPLFEAVRECLLPICLQFNLEREARNQRSFSARFVASRRIMTPQVLDVPYRHVLVMQRVTDLQKLADRPPGWTKALDRAVDLLFEMVFEYGLLHCDLHPGNLFAREGGELVVLDHGMTFALNVAQRRAMARFFLALISGDATAATELCLEMATRGADRADVGRLEAEIDTLFRDASRATVGEFDLRHFAASLIRLQARCGLRSTTAFTVPVMALLAIEGQLKALDPDADFQRAALPSVLRALEVARAST
jgi:ubiquinone biosynthesis protein